MRNRERRKRFVIFKKRLNLSLYNAAWLEALSHIRFIVREIESYSVGVGFFVFLLLLFFVVVVFVFVFFCSVFVFFFCLFVFVCVRGEGRGGGKRRERERGGGGGEGVLRGFSTLFRSLWKFDLMSMKGKDVKRQ